MSSYSVRSFLFVSWMRRLRALLRRSSGEEYQWAIHLMWSSSDRQRMPSVIRGPRGSFFADPFPIKDAGLQVLFFEDYSYSAGLARINFVEVSLSNVSEPKIALEQPYHLSYPMVFRWRDSIFMIPETHHNRTIELYRCERFPDKWVLDTTLFDEVSAFDTTFLDHGGKLWLFTCITDEGVFDYENLYLFHADDVGGPWISHPKNPVVRDRSRARPAGHIFERAGQLIRPGQDCSGSYGKRVVFSAIEELSTEDYREVPIDSLGPERIPGAIAVHTYNLDDEYEVIDVLGPSSIDL